MVPNTNDRVPQGSSIVSSITNHLQPCDLIPHAQISHNIIHFMEHMLTGEPPHNYKENSERESKLSQLVTPNAHIPSRKYPMLTLVLNNDDQGK